MKKIGPKIGQKIRAHLPKPNKVKIQREIGTISPKQSSSLERTPKRDIYDYSTEENGYFICRDASGNIRKVVRTIFPR